MSLTTETDNGAAAKAVRNTVDGEWNLWLHHLRIGYACIDAHIPVFVSDQDKHPLILEFNELDSSFDAEARRKVIADDLEDKRRKYVKANGREPAIGTDIREKRFVGATLDKKTFKKMMTAFRGLKPITSISVKPAGLAVIDIDEAKYPGSIERIAGAFEKHGVDQAAYPSNPTRSGGLHIYTRVETPVESNSVKYEGHLWGDLKGKTQAICVGTVLKSGRSYGSMKDLERLCTMYKAGTIPLVPQFVLDMVKTSSTSKKSKSSEADIIAQIEAEDPVDFDDLFGPPALDCPYDIDELLARNPVFAKRYHNPADSKSQNRLAAANALLKAHPLMPPHHLAAFYSGWPEGAGEFVDSNPSQGEWDNRQVAREYLLTRGSLGEVFGAVDDESDDEDVSPQVQALRETGRENWERMQANIKRKAEREAAEQGETSTDAQSTSAKTADATPLNELPFEFEHDVAANSKLPDWMVEDLVETKTLAVFYGKPNHGKSLLLLDMLYHVAAGRPWRGREVQQGCVLFVAVEGPNGTARRAKAWRHHHGIADDVKLPMAFIRVGIDLYKSEKDAKRIIAAVERLEKETGLPCRAIAIDTISATTPGMDQNSEMGFFISRCRLILDKTKSASVIAVHHPGKNLTNGLRGDSNLIGAVDMTLLVNDGVAETEKMRDGVSGQKIPFKVAIVNLWTNEKEKPVGAPVAIESSIGEAMGAVVGDDDNDATLTPTDTPADKVAGALRALRACAERTADATGDDSSEIGLSSNVVFAQLNKDRKAAGLPELKDRTIAPRLLSKLVEAGKLVKAGENKRLTEYRLAD